MIYEVVLKFQVGRASNCNATRVTTTLETFGNQSINQFNNQSIHHQSEVREWVISCYRGAHRRLIGVVVIGSSTEEYLFHFAEMQSILVVRPELHETHIARLRQLRYAFYTWEESVEKLGNNYIKDKIHRVIFMHYSNLNIHRYHAKMLSCFFRTLTHFLHNKLHF